MKLDDDMENIFSADMNSDTSDAFMCTLAPLRVRMESLSVNISES